MKDSIAAEDAGKGWNAARGCLTRKESRPWLERAFQLNECLHLVAASGVVETLLDELMDGRNINRRDRWRRTLDVLLANLIAGWRDRPKRPVRLSRNVVDWSGSASLSHVIELTDLLHESGYIEMKMGFYWENDKRTTRIWALPALLRTWQQLHTAAVTVVPADNPVELYELWPSRKNGKRKRIDQYRNTEFSHRVRKILNKANSVNNRAVIEYDDGFEIQRVRSFLRAIFIGKFTLYGRLHTYGCRHVQGLAECDREIITIDGYPVVEKDFSGLHPRLLYAAEGIQFDDDPYTSVVRKLLGKKGDNRAWSRRGRTLRAFLKVCLLALLNARDFTQAERAANDWLRNNRAERLDLRSLGITRSRPALTAFIETHESIAHNFASGKLTGLRTMNNDARIALDIVWHFVKQGKPILPIHDSFVVQAAYADELEATMQRAYARNTGGFVCPIK